MASFHQQGHWSEKDTLQLLQSMENNLPSTDCRGFTKTQAELDWDKVAFGNFSGEMCKLKWLQISQKLRKLRTLSELVLEAKVHVRRLQNSEKYRKHHDFPKRPLTTYLRFYKEQRARYCQMYPDLSNQQLTKLLTQKYKQLPEHIKQKYVQDFQNEKKVFEEKLARFKQGHPDLVQESQKSVVPRSLQTKAPEKPRGKGRYVKAPPETEFPQTPLPTGRPQGKPEKPPMNAYHKFHQDSWSSKELCQLPPRERMVEISRRWQRVPPSLKEQYRCQAEELRRRYPVDLDLWLKTLSAEEYASYKATEATLGKGKKLALLGGPGPKLSAAARWSSPGPAPARQDPLQVPGADAQQDDLMGEDDGSSHSSVSSSTDEDGNSEDGGPHLSSSGESSDLDSI